MILIDKCHINDNLFFVLIVSPIFLVNISSGTDVSRQNKLIFVHYVVKVCARLGLGLYLFQRCVKKKKRAFRRKWVHVEIVRNLRSLVWLTLVGPLKTGTFYKNVNNPRLINDQNCDNFANGLHGIVSDKYCWKSITNGADCRE